MLTRRPDWQARLQQYLLRSLSKPFAYGEFDCCLFVADAVEAMTGTDLAAEFRGKYHSCDEALSLRQAYTRGKGSLRSFVTKALREQGLEEIPFTLAQRGDIVLILRAKDYSLGVVDLSGREVVAAAEEAFLRLPLNLAVRGWRV